MDYLVVGLGNIGSEYANTRHNMGFMVLDAWAQASNVVFRTQRYGDLAVVSFKGRNFYLLKPSTYMNLSGECVAPVMNYYKESPENVIVLFDDISLDVGKIRIRKKGSAGGHNGIKSIIAHLGTQDFPRLKFGVGDKPAKMDLADYVLGRFSKDEEEILGDCVDKACDAVSVMVSEGADAAMNRFNG